MNQHFDDPQGSAPASLPPPVEPPSAGFVVQLFILPFVVVAVVVLVYLLFGRLAGGDRDAVDYVEAIRSTNENRRWRAAFELASLIQNDARLARDPALLGTLALELDRSLDDKSDDGRLRQYLARTLGAFQIEQGRLPDDRPVDAVSVLAEALGRDQPTEVRFAAAESLARLAARHDDRLEHGDAVSALAAVRGEADADPELRQLATYALGFFGGEEVVEELRRGSDDREADRFVRYNAAAALGRRGDPDAVDVLREMLRPSDLREVIRMETEAATRRSLESIHLEALRALQSAVRRGHPELAWQLRPEIDALTGTELTSVRTEARALVQQLQSTSAG